MPADRFAFLESPLYALCFAAPLAIGSVHTETQLALCTAAILLFLVAGLGVPSRRGLRVVPLAWVMLAALGWTAFQLLPLPSVLVGLVSPAARALRDEVAPGRMFMPLTLDRAATSLELVKQVAYACVFLVGTEVLRRNGASKRTAMMLGGFGAVMAALIAAHRLLDADKIYGFYVLHSIPGSGFFAPFVNGNHAAALLSLCALAGLGAATATQKPVLRALFGGCAGATTLALFATTSRGGAIGLAVGVLVLVTLLARMRYGTVRALLLSAGVTLILCAGAYVLADGLRARFTLDLPGNSLGDNQKTRGWQAALHLSSRYFVTGVGRGAFEAPASEVRTEDEQVRLVYPENVVLQCVSEWGVPVALALLVAAVLCFGHALRGLQLDPSLASLAAGIIAVLVHELFDFSLEFPGVALPLCLALAAVTGSAEHDRSRKKPRLRMRSAAIAVTGGIGLAIVLLGLSARPHTLSEDLESLRQQVAARDPGAARALERAIVRHAASAEIEMLAGANALQQRDPTALRHLNRAMRLQPSAGRPHHLAALELRRMGHVRQAALELRLAAERGHLLDPSRLVPLVGAAAVDAVPRTVDAYLGVASYLLAAKMIDAAEIAFARAAEIDPGPRPRAARLAALPPAHRAAAAEAVAVAATTGDELASAVRAFRETNALERADAVARTGLVRHTDSAALFVEASRVAEAKGDLERARSMLGQTSRLDRPGKILVEERVLELARQSRDPDATIAAEARLKLLRLTP